MTSGAAPSPSPTGTPLNRPPVTPSPRPTRKRVPARGRGVGRTDGLPLIRRHLSPAPPGRPHPRPLPQGEGIARGGLLLFDVLLHCGRLGYGGAAATGGDTGGQ